MYSCSHLEFTKFPVQVFSEQRQVEKMKCGLFWLGYSVERKQIQHGTNHIVMSHGKREIHLCFTKLIYRFHTLITHHRHYYHIWLYPGKWQAVYCSRVIGRHFGSGRVKFALHCKFKRFTLQQGLLIKHGFIKCQ